MRVRWIQTLTVVEPTEVASVASVSSLGRFLWSGEESDMM